MSDLQEAVGRARRRVAEHAERYGDVPATRFGPPYDEIGARLSEWAVPDPSGYEIRSIRRGGQPITWAKRLLVRLLSQFTAQLISDQSRFNVLLLNYVRTLEQRVSDLEAALRGTSPLEALDAVKDECP